jgi:hypothetical protein
MNSYKCFPPRVNSTEFPFLVIYKEKLKEEEERNSGKCSTSNYTFGYTQEFCCRCCFYHLPFA